MVDSPMKSKALEDLHARTDREIQLALASASSAERILGVTPRVAILDSRAGHIGAPADTEKSVAAARLARDRNPELTIEGGLDARAAADADVLVFPDLNAGNIGYKLAQYLAGATAIGPFLQGFARPVSDLSRGASVDDIVAAAAVMLASAGA